MQNQARSTHRITVATWGSLGDLHPYLAIAVELKARGHQVLVATNAVHRDKVRALGFDFAPLGPHLEEGSASREVIERAMHPWKGSPWLFRNFLDPHARLSFAELDDACVGADTLLAHCILLSAPLIAQRRKLPLSVGVLSPISLWSRFDVPVAPLPLGAAAPREGLAGRAWGHISQRLTRSATRPWFRRFDALRAEMGFPTEPHPLFELPFSHQVLALFSRELGLPQSDWPRFAQQCGVPILQQQVLAGGMSGWKRWLAEGEAPIVWTLGSTAVHIARGFWRVAFHAARRMFLSRGVRSLFLVGKSEYWKLPLPARSWGFVAEYAPFEELLPRARAVVHQGGVGTTQATMRAGAPQLVVPWAQDQPDNAARIVARGLGLSLPRGRFDDEDAVDALSRLCDAPKYLQRARQAADSMRAHEPNPAARAADAVEAHLAATKNRHTDW